MVISQREPMCNIFDLVNLFAHEMAHSWPGTLVTNATWNYFNLNEGWDFLERNISAKVSKDGGLLSFTEIGD